MSSSSDVFFGLSPRKRELLSRLLQEEAARRRIGDPQVAPIPHAGRHTLLPLSFTQQRLWFFDQLHPKSPIYNIATAVRLTGELNVEALEQTLSEIVRRHEILRTIFQSVDGQVSQIIAQAAPVHLPVFEICASTEQEKEREAQRLAEDEARKPFDLAKGPLFRASLLCLDPVTHVVLFTTHHIVSDGWSMGMLMREVVALYDAFSRGQQSPLPELPIQYADYAVWQRSWLHGEALEQQLVYWKKQLAGIPPVLQLPTDRPRPLIQTHRGSHYSCVLPKELSEELVEFSRREGVTLYMTLLAAFQTLLHRYSGQDDIVVGTDIANRTRPQLEPLIGCFVNLLVIRADLTGDPSFQELLTRVKETALAAHAHCDLPFEMLVEALQPERRLSQTPLFQVLFVLQNQLGEAVQLGELVGQRIDVDNGTAKFDISLVMTETPHGLVTTWHYSTDLFDAETIAHMSESFEQLLRGVVADPQQRLSALLLLGPEDRERMLFCWNETGREYPSEQCIHELFEAQAVRSPNRIAVQGEQEQLTYAELDQRANQLAHYLREQGVRPGTLVGICMERAPEMFVSVLAVLKAGAAFVPMDPSYPLQRLAWMLEDCGIWLLLTQERLAAELRTCAVSVFSVDAEWEQQVGWRSGERVKAVVRAEQPAYVIYTSGSTGQPKGILLRHQGLCNLILASNEMFEISAESRVLQFSSFGFDVSVWETFMSLTAGATLCLSGQNTNFSMVELRERLRREEISVALLPPSVLRLLGSDDLPRLRTLIAVGEKCTAENVARWAEGRKFFNGYGPAEATVTVSAHLTSLAENYPQGPPIGHPFPNTEFYILDRHLQPMPIGVAGELCVGGTQLALGYVKRPALTAEKFVPHPFSREAGARLYRTGDLARYLADGNVEYVGRVDQQVKLRGYRIEPGEIAAVLESHTAVSEAVVLLREEERGDKRLVAYMVASPGEEPPRASALRSHLKERLPEYMVPAVFLFLDALPLTPNGKVDRKALPAPDLTRAALEAEYVAPLTPEEELIAGIWSDLLDVEPVGVKDNFFELGGHSLLATSFIIRLIDSLGVELPLHALFESPTVESLARTIARPSSKQTAPALQKTSQEKTHGFNYTLPSHTE